MAIIEADHNLSSLLAKAKEPVLIDFWAPWCAPCKDLMPMLETLAKEWKDKLSVIKVNIDKHPGEMAAYQIKTIPSLVVIDREGKVVAEWRGTTTLVNLTQQLSSLDIWG